MNNKIWTIRNEIVILDRDLAELCQMETRVFNQAIKRNINLFSEINRFQLNNYEFENWKSQIVISNNDNMGLRKLPFVFTKVGVRIALEILKKNVDLGLLFEEKIETELIVKNEDLRSKIHNIRGLQVILDFDLAQLYQVETKVLNQAVKRNLNRFPNRFRFQLNEGEMNELVTNCDQFKNLKHSSKLPFVFTERGVAMLATILHSDIAIDMSIQIMDMFVESKKFISENANIFKRLGNIEEKLINNDSKFNIIFKAIEENEIKPKQGIFYNGQMFDAYKLAAEIIRSAKKSIILIDNYIDESTLLLFSKRNKNTKTTFYTKNFTTPLKQDLAKYNSQYEHIEIKKLKSSHDRFLIIDKKTVYHFGASLKDLGLAWFGFSKLDIDANDIIEKLG